MHSTNAGLPPAAATGDAAVPILLADSVTALDARHRGCVLVTGSHGGLIAGRYAFDAGVRALICNDAGRGLDDAGIASLPRLAAAGCAVAAVAHTSARIAIAADTLESGVIAAVNDVAAACGVRVGQSARAAAAALRAAPLPRGTADLGATEARHLLAPATAGRSAITGLDSIGHVMAGDAGALLVIGSHGGLHGGDPASALPVDARAAAFHDAGRGRADAGTSRLPVLDARGIVAVTVDHRSARIGDACSLWGTGTISAVNACAARRSIAPGDALRDAWLRLARER